MIARVEGLPELRVTLRKMTDRTRRNVEREVKRAALNVQNNAKRAAPVDTGRLRNSIAHEIEGDGLEATVGTNVEYAPFVEFGTRRGRAQPYLLPALERERGPFRKAIADALMDAARKAR